MRHLLGTRTVLILLVSCLIAWVGGWRAHSREMASRATHRYERVEAEKAKFLQWQRDGLVPVNEVFSTETLPDGPQSAVNWCLPVLPAVLLADSEYVVGPRYGKGGT